MCTSRFNWLLNSSGLPIEDFESGNQTFLYDYQVNSITKVYARVMIDSCHIV